MAGYLIILVYGCFLLYNLGASGKKTIKILICICFFQNICLVALSRFLNDTQYTILTVLKELYIALYLAIAVLKAKRIPRDGVFCLSAIMALCGMALLFGKGMLMGRISSLRQLLLPFLFYMVGRVSRLTKQDVQELMDLYIKLCIVSVFFGIIEYTMGTKLWLPLGLQRYAEAKGTSGYLLSNGMLVAFYTFDLGLGFRVRRMASLLVDPVIMGMLLSYGLIFLFFDRSLSKSRLSKNLKAIILAFGLVLTLAKGGIIISAISYCILLRYKSRNKWISTMLMITLGVATVAYFAYSMKKGLSISKHFGGLISGFESMLSHPLGLGVGSAGSFARTYGGVANRSGNESYIGSMLVQTGLVGLVLHAVLFWRVWSPRKRYRLAKASQMQAIVSILSGALILTSFVNYTAISFTACFIFFIMSGATKRLIGDHIAIFPNT